jgi:hypothetical protein
MIARIPENLPVFFIAGMPRSGTTWVQLSLDCHPEILCMGESKFFGDLIPALESEFLAYNQRRATGKDTWAPTVTGFPAEHRARIYRQIFFNLADANAAAKNPLKLKVVGEKTPDNLYQWEMITSIFPTAKFVHIIRDCRACAVSAHARFMSRLPADLDKSAYYRDYAKAWQERIQKIRSTLLGTDSYIEIRYEQLHRDPMPVIGAVCEFLEVSTDKQIIGQCVSNTRFEKLTGGRSRGNPDPTSHYRSGEVDGWKRELNPRELEIINNEAGDLLRQLGYEI